MAKKMCKCMKCGIEFNRNAIQAVVVGYRRYGHATCYPENTDFVPMEVSKIDPEEKALNDYINELYKEKANWAMIKKQIKDFHKEKNYSYTGMLKTLKYFYEIKHNKIEDSNGGIGIIDFTYEEATKYYYAIWQAQQINFEQKKIDNKVYEYIISEPKKIGIKNKLIEFAMEEEF